ncbi:DNA-binding MarR family transcriptional regulator [Bradyrhizobium sp. LM6.10]
MLQRRHLVAPAQIDAREVLHAIGQVGLRVILLEVDEGRPLVTVFRQQVELVELGLAVEDAADAPDHALLDHAVADAEPVPIFQRTFREADRARAFADTIGVIQEDDALAALGEVDRQRQPDRASTNDHDRMLGRALAGTILIKVAAIAELGFWPAGSWLAPCANLGSGQERTDLLDSLTCNHFEPVPAGRQLEFGALSLARTSSDIALKTRVAEEALPIPQTRLDLFKFAPFRLNRLAAEVSAALSVEYQERHGLDIPAWRVIATLGFRNDACSAQYIAQCTRTHKSTISRAVTMLLHQGLIERVENEADRREFRLQLTKEGAHALRGAVSAIAAAGRRDPRLPHRAGAQAILSAARQDRTEPRPDPDQRRGRRQAGVLITSQTTATAANAAPRHRPCRWRADRSPSRSGRGRG